MKVWVVAEVISFWLRVPFTYKNTESVTVNPLNVKVGVLSLVMLSLFLTPVSDKSSRSIVTPVTTGATSSTVTVVLPELSDTFPDGSFAYALYAPVVAPVT